MVEIKAAKDQVERTGFKPWPPWTFPLPRLRRQSWCPTASRSGKQNAPARADGIARTLRSTTSTRSCRASGSGTPRWPTTTPARAGRTNNTFWPWGRRRATSGRRPASDCRSWTRAWRSAPTTPELRHSRRAACQVPIHFWRSLRRSRPAQAEPRPGLWATLLDMSWCCKRETVTWSKNYPTFRFRTTDFLGFEPLTEFWEKFKTIFVRTQSECHRSTSQPSSTALFCFRTFKDWFLSIYLFSFQQNFHWECVCHCFSSSAAALPRSQLLRTFSSASGTDFEFAGNYPYVLSKSRMELVLGKMTFGKRKTWYETWQIFAEMSSPTSALPSKTFDATSVFTFSS